MQVWPAIDLRGGKCVRLRQGDYSQETVFGEDPQAMARHWVVQGAERLHLVDLDAARTGEPTNLEALSAILSAVDVPCQIGGGVRDEPRIERLLRLGASRLVVGTAALTQPDWFGQMVGRYPGRLVLGIDARQGYLATDGWTRTGRQQVLEAVTRFAPLPLAAAVYTDIDTDGMLVGPNLPAITELSRAAPWPLIASGGIASAQHITQLATTGAAGCIIGRALYEGRLSLADALAAAAVSAAWGSSDPWAAAQPGAGPGSGRQPSD